MISSNLQFQISKCTFVQSFKYTTNMEFEMKRTRFSGKSNFKGPFSGVVVHATRVHEGQRVSDGVRSYTGYLSSWAHSTYDFEEIILCYNLCSSAQKVLEQDIRSETKIGRRLINGRTFKQQSLVQYVHLKRV